MTIDHHPIPREALPPGWGPAEHCRERIAYCRTRPPIELIAVHTPLDRSHPTLGLEHCWELRYRYSVGELSVSDPIGQVSTRRAALDGLLRCMHQIHDHVDDLEDPLEVEATLERVPLPNSVPEDPVSP